MELANGEYSECCSNREVEGSNDSEAAAPVLYHSKLLRSKHMTYLELGSKVTLQFVRVEGESLEIEANLE